MDLLEALIQLNSFDCSSVKQRRNLKEALIHEMPVIEKGSDCNWLLGQTVEKVRGNSNTGFFTVVGARKDIPERDNFYGKLDRDASDMEEGRWLIDMEPLEQREDSKAITAVYPLMFKLGAFVPEDD